ncbi:tyrosine kinase receptor Cad96Ca-like [Patiria miniata]|uniref:Receptor protein-tyrosine kinase n=1 Tax=Patiria miniata TaxID=46514 RepID=A0A914AGK1_PATMI|nr:tyrosine kinase receptor Cad96Ca-like [Patiria miniata]
MYITSTVPVDAKKITIGRRGKVYQSGGVMPVQEDKRESVTCWATGTRPAADISWILAEDPYSSDGVETEISEGLYDTEGMFEFQVENYMDYKKLVCVAKTRDMEQEVTVAVSLVVERANSSSAGVIAGVTLGALGLVVLVLVAIIVVKKKRMKRRLSKEDVQVSTIHHQDRNRVPTPPMLRRTASDSCGPPVSKRPCVYPDTSDGNSRYVTLPASQPFPRSKLTLLNVIGQGNFGLVYLASASDIIQSGSQTYVALKTLKENTEKDVKKNLLREVDLMKRMPPHSNVVRYLGSCLEKEPLYVIVEYLSNGNLQEYLRLNRTKEYTYIDACSESLSCADLIKFARDIAKGMAFLSSNKCIHCDLAARNVLVAGDKVCKISDFGLACDAGNVKALQKQTDNARPLRWMALESLDKEMFSTKSDVWSFGIVLWEIVTFGARPFPNMVVGDVIAKLREGYRMPKPRHCDEKLYDMMRSCWDADPDRRPRFSELLNSLESFLETEADYIIVGLYEEALYLTPNGDDTKHHEKM